MLVTVNDVKVEGGVAGCDLLKAIKAGETICIVVGRKDAQPAPIALVAIGEDELAVEDDAPSAPAAADISDPPAPESAPTPMPFVTPLAVSEAELQKAKVAAGAPEATEPAGAPEATEPALTDDLMGWFGQMSRRLLNASA